MPDVALLKWLLKEPSISFEMMCSMYKKNSLIFVFELCFSSQKKRAQNKTSANPVIAK